MVLGTVTGTLKLRSAAAGYGDVNWVQIRTGEETLVAADCVGCAKGDVVLLVRGGAAERYCMEYTADALVVAVVSENGNNS